MKPQDPKDPLPDLEEDEEGLTLSSTTERDAVVASVMRDQAEKTVVRASMKPHGPRPLLSQLMWLAISTTAAVYVWFGSPAWLEPDPVPLPPVAAEVAALRAGMFIQAQAIEHYREHNGRAPAFLEEAGPTLPGVTYRRISAQSYLLQGRGDRVRLTYTSRDSLALFLGSAGEALLTGAN